jgi:polysaccharide deacetylase family protein (PEP-CTERM system associated)
LGQVPVADSGTGRPAVTFTLDLEDHRPDDGQEPRTLAVLERVLSHLDTRGIVGTFFVVGELAQQYPDAVRRVADAGHEVGLHGWDHTPLPQLTPETFRDHTARGRELLATLTGQSIGGFRAPVFSLTPDAAWAPEVLAEAGFDYSSSVLPARNPLYGWPGAPQHPFRWPCGLLELPAPVGGVGWASLPFLGGVYARVLPLALINRLLGRLHTPAPWSYVHAHDFDADEPFWRMPEVGRLGSRLLWVNRSKMFERVDAIVGVNPGPPLCDVAAAVLSEAPVYEGS